MSAGLPESLYPTMYIRDENTPSTYNDPQLAKQVKQSMVNELGADSVLVSQPVMAGEDFGRYGLTSDNLPITMFWLGGVAPEQYQQSIELKKTLPSLHSSQFAPDYPLTIKTGVRAMTASALDLFAKQ
jgi:hippurate hydrolase